VNKGALRLCRGDWHSILIKIPLIHSVSFQFGGLGALFEGAKSTKVPLSDGTEKGHGISEKEEPEATASLSFPNIDR